MSLMRTYIIAAGNCVHVNTRSVYGRAHEFWNPMACLLFDGSADVAKVLPEGVGRLG